VLTVETIWDSFISNESRHIFVSEASNRLPNSPSNLTKIQNYNKTIRDGLTAHTPKLPALWQENPSAVKQSESSKQVTTQYFDSAASPHPGSPKSPPLPPGASEGQDPPDGHPGAHTEAPSSVLITVSSERQLDGLP